MNFHKMKTSSNEDQEMGRSRNQDQNILFVMCTYVVSCSKLVHFHCCILAYYDYTILYLPILLLIDILVASSD